MTTRAPRTTHPPPPGVAARRRLLARLPVRHRHRIVQLLDGIDEQYPQPDIGAAAATVRLLDEALAGDERALWTLHQLVKTRQRWRALGAVAPDDLEILDAVLATVEAFTRGDVHDPIAVLVDELLAELDAYLRSVATPLPDDPCPPVPAPVGSTITAHAPPAPRPGPVVRAQEANPPPP